MAAGGSGAVRCVPRTRRKFGRWWSRRACSRPRRRRSPRSSPSSASSAAAPRATSSSSPVEGERLVGYTCYGPIPGSELGWDLYWIAVAPGQQGRGLGGRLLERTEAAIRRAGGRTLWADTSSGPPYEKTRAFYRAHGFTLAADLADFYRPGDGKAIYRKELT